MGPGSMLGMEGVSYQDSVEAFGVGPSACIYSMNIKTTLLEVLTLSSCMYGTILVENLYLRQENSI